MAEVYGERIERIVLSCRLARAAITSRSPVFIKDPGTLTEELDKLAYRSSRHLLVTDAVISGRRGRAAAGWRLGLDTVGTPRSGVRD